jgi:ABC-type sugar transport system ATPase subunit
MPQASENILDAAGIHKRFGAIAALRDVSLSLGRGEIRALIGENGAGKSTLVKILSGFHAPDAGTIAIAGVSHHIASPRAAQALGVAVVAQELSLAPHLSVLDNIWLGSNRLPLLHRRHEFRAKAAELLAALGAAIDLDRPAGDFSMGQRQMIEIARVLARDAQILILDEPTATLSDVEIERLFAALRALKAQGRSVIYITHRLGEVFEICDSVTVLRNGAHVWSGAVSEATRGDLVEWMLGRSFSDMYPAKRPAGGGEPALRVQRLTIPGTIADLSFDAPRGQILCLAGQVGSGANAVVRALAGLQEGVSGEVAFEHRRVPVDSRSNNAALGVVFISDDRAAEGIFSKLTVLENLVVTQLSRHTALRPFLSWGALQNFAAMIAQRVKIELQRLRSRGAELSGGNQQKLLFGRAVGEQRPGLLLMNEPTRGVDVGARAEIYRLMRTFGDAGWTLVMSSSDLEEVVGIADVVITMYRGKQVARREGTAVDMVPILGDITHAPAG